MDPVRRRPLLTGLCAMLGFAAGCLGGGIGKHAPRSLIVDNALDRSQSFTISYTSSQSEETPSWTTLGEYTVEANTRRPLPDDLPEGFGRFRVSVPQGSSQTRKNEGDVPYVIDIAGPSSDPEIIIAINWND